MSDDGALTEADAVVIGAGIFGMSIAFQLVKRGAGRVVLVDSRAPAGGNSGRTFGQVRRHYSNELTIRLANRGFEVLNTWADEVGVGDPGYVRTGYLLMVPEESMEACRGNVDLGSRCGVDTRLVDPDEIREIEPLVSTERIAGGAYEPDGGFVDVTKMILAWFAAATAGGLVSDFGSPVTGIEATDGRVTGVRTDRGSIRAPVVVNAAGAWGRDLARPLGLELPVSFTRVQLAVLRQARGLPLIRTAVTHAAAGLVIRPDRGPLALVVVYDEGLGADRDAELDPERDPGYEARVRSSLSEFVPDYADADWESAASGVYDVTPDWHPILGWAPGVEGLYLVLGWSGHGLKLAPAVGEVVADEILGRTALVDVSPLRLERFAEGRLLRLAYGPGARA
ncbi:MAG: NAD(P)/FAD-dependent oxidoreductase [Actinomycetota bacterium]